MTSGPVPWWFTLTAMERETQAHVASLRLPMLVTRLPGPARTHSVSTSYFPGSSLLPPVHIYPKVVKTQDSGASLLGLGPTSELAI